MARTIWRALAIGGMAAAAGCATPERAPTLTYRQLETARCALGALEARLDTAVLNLANIDTPGYKATRIVVEELPRGADAGGVRVAGSRLDMGQGSPVVTQNILDLYIDGAGFIQVEGDGPDGAERSAFTRAAMLRRNADGELVTAGGRRLMPRIVVPEGVSGVVVDSEGAVYTLLPGSCEPEMVGQIELAVFTDPGALRSVGEGAFAPTVGSGSATLGQPGTDHRGVLRLGMYESSNVDPERERIEIERVRRAMAYWDSAIGVGRTGRATAVAGELPNQ